VLSKILIPLLFIAVSLQAYSQASFIGKWKRIKKPVVKYRGNITRQVPNWNDLEIRADSTFHIEGDTSNQHSTTAGWYSAAAINGTWECRDHKHLIFWLGTKKEMPLSYRIVILTSKKLILRPPLDRDSKYDLNFERLQ
jgi:hypothetical protein